MPYAQIAAKVIGAGVDIAGGLAAGDAAKTAGEQQQQQQQKILDYVNQMYASQQPNFQPNITMGQNALSTLGGFYGLPGGNTQGAQQGYQAFQGTPFYQFPLQQANLATNRALAASGLTGSGGALRDLSQLNAGYASQGLGQYLTGLGGLSTQGLGAAGTLGQLGAATYNPVAAAYTGIGNAQAAGTVGRQQAIWGGVQNAVGSLTGGSGSSSGAGGNSGLSSFAGLIGGGGGGGGNAQSSFVDNVSGFM